MFLLVKIFMMTYFLWSASASMDVKELREDIQKLVLWWHDVCRDVTESTEENLNRVKAGNFIDDASVQKYLYCMWRISGVMGADFELNLELLDQYIPERMHKTAYATMIEKCHNEAKNGTDLPAYEKTYKLQKCVYKGDPVDFIMY